jgi:P27 family predicted phage terminase small subunit
MPTKLRLLRGDHPERVNRAEPQPAGLPVVKPDYLSAEAAAKWDELAPHLESMGVLSAADVDLLAAYCECWARWCRLVVLAAKSPPVFNRGGEGAEAVLVRNPVWSQVRDAEGALRVLGREFGLTPSARAGLRTPGGPGDPGERLLTGGR